MSHPWEHIDWEALDRLREGFLTDATALGDYWQSEADLHAYDQTFAQRIGWKWDGVLEQLRLRGWTPPAVEVQDWGCGSGIAHRSFFRAYPEMLAHGLAIWDRSRFATAFAQRTAAKFFPQLSARVSETAPGAVMLLSHVLTELTAEGLEALLPLVRTAAAVVWVEPGTHAASRRLIQVREQLRSEFQVVAPCVHRETCGLLTEENEPHWCHFFAEPPGWVFTDAYWTRFGQVTGIDLRSLPYSFLVLDRRPAPALPPDAVRILGRPRVYKGYTLLTGCQADGVSECRLSKRTLPEMYRQTKKEELKSLAEWNREGREVRAFREVAIQPGGQESGRPPKM